MQSSNGNYPAGADVPWAPWNQPPIEDIEVEVTVSLTISKTLKIHIPGINGKPFPITDTELKKAVVNQRWLPHEIANIGDVILSASEQKSIIEDLDNWTEDDFEVVLEDTPLYYGDDDSRAE